MGKDNKYKYRFRGHLDAGEALFCKFVATIDFDVYDPSSLKVDLVLTGSEEENKAATRCLSKHSYNHLWLLNDDDESLPVEVLGITGYSYHESHYSLRANAVQVGITKKQILTDSNFYVVAQLTPTGILTKPGYRELHYTGKIKHTTYDEGEVEIQTKLGPLKISQQYGFYETEEFGSAVTHSVEQVTVTGELSAMAGQSLYEINEELQGIFISICHLLSLCYRQPVRFYEIKYLSSEASGKVQTYMFRARLRSFEKKIRQDELISYRQMINGGFHELFESLTISNRKSDISRAIGFLAGSHKEITLESSYFLAYAALDLSVSIHNPDGLYLLGSAKWKKIEKKLRDFLSDLAEEQGLSAVIEQMKDKMPELRRASGDSRIIATCRDLSVKTVDLWPKAGFENGLKQATRFRNELFHSALIDSPIDLYDNLVRIRILTERILLKILRWPEDKIWWLYTQTLLGVNEQK